VEIMPGKRGLRFVQIKGLPLFWEPKRGKIRGILINLHKSSSHEPLIRMH